MYLNDQSISSGGNGGTCHGSDQIPLTCTMAGIHYYGKMTYLLYKGDAAKVKGVTVAVSKVPDTLFAENYLIIPSFSIYSAAFSHSSILEDKPLLRTTGIFDFPIC